MKALQTTLITNISSVFQTDRNSEKENHGFFSIHVYGKAINEGRTKYYDVVKVDETVYSYFGHIMMQTFSI